MRKEVSLPAQGCLTDDVLAVKSVYIAYQAIKVCLFQGQRAVVISLH